MCETSPAPRVPDVNKEAKKKKHRDACCRGSGAFG
jgi:hypothetical protein